MLLCTSPCHSVILLRVISQDEDAVQWLQSVLPPCLTQSLIDSSPHTVST